MGWTRLFWRSWTAPLLDLEAIPPDDWTVPLQEAFEFGDFRAAQKVLHSAPSWNDRSYLLHLAAEWVTGVPQLDEFLDGWVDEAYDSGIPWTVRGLFRIEQAWSDRKQVRARGSEKPGGTDWQRRLEQADADLIRAAEREPQDPTPAAARLWTAMGQGADRGEVRQRFDNLCQLDPLHRPGHESYLTSQTPRWGGSFDEALAFARSVARASRGTGLPSLIPRAHLEHFAALHHARDGRAADYFAEDAFREEIRLSFEHSLGHPDYRPDRQRLEDLNVYAFVFTQMGDFGRGLAAFDAMECYLTTYPWSYFGRPETEARSAREQCWRHTG